MDKTPETGTEATMIRWQVLFAPGDDAEGNEAGCAFVAALASGSGMSLTLVTPGGEACRPETSGHPVSGVR